MVTPSNDLPGTDREQWNANIAALGGDLLQRWEWGAFKARHGWRVERVQAESGAGRAMAQILFRHRGPVSIAYIPRGPVFEAGGASLGPLLDRIDAACRRHRAICLFVDQDRPLPIEHIAAPGGFAIGSAPVQTPRTVRVALGSDDTLIGNLRKDARRNLKHALRHGVIAHVVDPSPAHRATFYRLMQETGERQSFGIRSRQYYDDFLDLYGSAATLVFTERRGQVTHALIAARGGQEGRSMYAGSSASHRGRGDAVLLRFVAMQWARDHGCTQYDLGGIALAAHTAGSDHERNRSAALIGVDHLKLGFGGTVITYPDALERCYRPGLAKVMRYMHPRFRMGFIGDPVLI